MRDGMRDEWKPAADAAMDRYAATGDPAAWKELYRLLEPRLRAFLVRRTRDAAWVDDLVQQTFLQMHRARGHFARGAEVTPWSFAIARRLLIDGLRKGGRELLADDGAGDDGEDGDHVPCSDDSPESAVARRRIARRIREELARMPEAHRLAFEAIQADGLSVAEAAQFLGTTRTAVKLRAHRAYEWLRARLGDEVREELGGLP